MITITALTISDQMMIIQLKEKLEDEIAELKAQIVGTDNAIKAGAGVMGFNVDLNRQRSRLQERLTVCLLIHAKCWPSQWSVLQTLEDFYQPEVLH